MNQFCQIDLRFNCSGFVLYFAGFFRKFLDEYMAIRLGILTGGGDVPGLNLAIKAATLKAIDSGYRILGIRRGWQGLLHYDLDEPSTHEKYVFDLDYYNTRTIDRSGGTILHTSRTNPQKVRAKDAPGFLTNSGFGKEIDEEGIVPGPVLMLQMMLEVASGNEDLLKQYRAKSNGASWL